MSLLILNSIRRYYAYYLQSLINPNSYSYIPVFHSHGEAIKTYLDDVTFYVEEQHAIDQECLDIANQLAQYVDSRNYDAIMRLYESLISYTELKEGAFIVGTGDCAGVAMLRALSEKRPFICCEYITEELENKLRAEAQSIYYVSSNITNHEMNQLINSFSQGTSHQFLHGISGIPLGILHARTIESLTLLDAKQRRESIQGSSPAQRNAIIDAFLVSDEGEAEENLVIQPYTKWNKDELVLIGRMNILSITSHGMSDLIHINSDFICGKSPFIGLDTWSNKRMPSCMEHEGFCFFKKEGMSIKAYEIRANHLFVNSCGSMQFKESTFDPLFNLGYSFIEGHALSYVGALRWKDGGGSESLLYYRLLQAGFSLGEATLILNRSLYSNQFESTLDVFCLIGDPATRPNDTNGECFYETLIVSTETNNYKVDMQTGLTIVKINSVELSNALSAQRLLIEISEGNKTFVSVIPSDSSSFYVLIYSYVSKPRELTIHFHDYSELFEEVLLKYHYVNQNLNNTLGLNKFYPNWIKQGGKKNIDNRLLNISRLYKSSYSDNSQIKKLGKSCFKFFQEIDQMDHDIAQALYEAVCKTSFRFSEHYQDNFLLRKNNVEETCYLCGDKLTTRILAHILSSTVERTELICSKCGSVEDKPDNSILVQISFDEYVKQDSTFPVVLKITNHSDQKYDGYALVSVRKSSDYPLNSRQPVKKVSIPPKTSSDIEFYFDVGQQVPVHQYALQAAFVSMTQVYLAGRGFWITGEHEVN